MHLVPPNFFRKDSFQFLVGITVRHKRNLRQCFFFFFFLGEGWNKLHYGLCENKELAKAFLLKKKNNNNNNSKPECLLHSVGNRDSI